MTKERLERLRYIEKALKAVKDDIQKLNRRIANSTGRNCADKVKCSMSEFPYIETRCRIEGVDRAAYYRLKAKLERKEAELQERFSELEDWLEGIEDEKLYLIFRLKYRNGMTNKEIAEEIGYDKSRVSQLINGYLRSE